MALRAESFRSRLVAHKYKQLKEGYCWPALVEAIFHSRGLNSWGKEQLAERMRTSVAYGTDTDQVITFLESQRVPAVPKDRCSMSDLYILLERLPQEADLIACFWDERVNPGYNKKTDPPESHNVAVLNAPIVRGCQKILFYDTSTYIGGLLNWSAEKWKRAWLGEPESGKEPDKDGNLVDYTPGGLLIIGLTKEDLAAYGF